MNALPRISDEQRRARLGVRHRLADSARTDDVADIADSVLALHGTDPATVYLSAMARMTTPSLATTSTALYDARSLVRHHGMRRTIWVCTPATARVMHASCTIDVARVERRNLIKWVALSEIPDPEAWVAAASADTLAALHRLGPTSARALGKAVPALTTKIRVGSGTYSAEQAAHTRLLLDLGFEAAIVRTTPTGGWTSSEYRWSVMADWLPGGLAGADETESRTELVRRYLSSFGPATTADVQWWTGWTQAPVKAALAALGAVQVQLEHGDETGWLLPDDLADVEPPAPWVALLPALDPTAMGWKARTWYLGEHTTFGGPLFDKNGNVGPTVWVDGRAVGGWAQRPDGSIAVEFLTKVPARAQRAVRAMAEQWQVEIGDTRVTPRFPTPLQRSLAQR